MIKNLTKRTIIQERFENKESFLGKMIGLIGKKQSGAIAFKTRFGIHTFFLNLPIDVLILDKKQHVVVLRKNLEPFRAYFWNLKFNLVLELPQESIEKSKTAIGDTIKLDL